MFHADSNHFTTVSSVEKPLQIFGSYANAMYIGPTNTTVRTKAMLLQCIQDQPIQRYVQKLCYCNVYRTNLYNGTYRSYATAMYATYTGPTYTTVYVQKLCYCNVCYVYRTNLYNVQKICYSVYVQKLCYCNVYRTNLYNDTYRSYATAIYATYTGPTYTTVRTVAFNKTNLLSKRPTSIKKSLHCWL